MKIPVETRERRLAIMYLSMVCGSRFSMFDLLCFMSSQDLKVFRELREFFINQRPSGMNTIGSYSINDARQFGAQLC